MQLTMSQRYIAAAKGPALRPGQATRGLGATAPPVGQRRGLQSARAEPWNEGAAQVRRLVDRDRKELDLDELEAQFAEEPASTGAADGSVAVVPAEAEAATSAIPFQATSSAADKRPVSPFGPSSSGSGSGSSNPFGSIGAAPKRPFFEPAGLSPNMPTPQKDTAPWWTKITTAQIMIVLSFTTIITLMVSTFFFVLATGAIHFNE